MLEGKNLKMEVEASQALSFLLLTSLEASSSVHSLFPPAQVGRSGEVR